MQQNKCEMKIINPKLPSLRLRPSMLRACFCRAASTARKPEAANCGARMLAKYIK